MEMEIREELAAAVERLAATAGLLEQAVERLAQRETELAASAGAVECVVATVESPRERELEGKLALAEQKIAALEARAAAATPEPVTGARKTLPPSAAGLFAKHGTVTDTMQAGALDAALVHLSLEQRIAVKADLIRAGLLG